MSEPIGPGDDVQCVDASGEAQGHLVEAQVYKVIAVMQLPPSDRVCPSCHGMLLKVQPGLGGYWCGGRFRPILKSRKQWIEDLQRGVDVNKELETA